MKLFHLADLHIGKRYNELSLIDDQQYILNQILCLCDGEKPDGVIIAGDVYDKSVPSAEAVELFDRFLNSLTERNLKVFIVSGNHDSAERVAFGSKLMRASGVYVSPVYGGEVKPVVLSDNFGEVNFWLLPFIKPATVRRFFEGREIDGYTAAVDAAVGAMNIEEEKRNVLVAHQFVTGSVRSGSEELVVGDIGNVDAAVFRQFDYVALGHVHRAQNIGSERVRYCGTPLKYSLSEADDVKSVTVVALGEKGSVTVTAIPLKPLRDVREIRGAYEELTKRSFYGGADFCNDLLHIVLTDEEEITDALAKLRLVYPNVMSLRYDNARTQKNAGAEAFEALPARSPLELFSSLYEAQNNAEMSDKQRELICALIEKAWGDEI
ncbi:MAG: exonuclease SbcCD subunit D [Clostridia bacterium]|nr:exonuclease SbcCD subunit D [Clostridia bacterium]